MAEQDPEDELFVEECNKMMQEVRLVSFRSRRLTPQAVTLRRSDGQKVQTLDVPIPSSVRAGKEGRFNECCR